MKDRYKNEINKEITNIIKSKENINREVDLKLIEFIEFNRKLGNSVIVYSLFLLLLKILLERKNFYSNQKWIYIDFL